MYAIETENLTKTYGDKIVVNNINLKVKKGIIFGFLGKNGAGKSTFINMITGLVAPSKGSYTLISNLLSKREVCNKVGVLPDYSTFYEDLTALEHLKYFSDILNAKLTKKQLIEILKNVELEDAINLKTKKFSFGMKKKLGIAQALVNNPEVLFLDEPTSGVDANSALKIHHLIKDIAEQGTTVFLTSHNLDEVEKLCDEIAIMDKGTIKVQGSMQELRNQFNNNIEVYIKHVSILEKQGELLKQSLKPLVNNIKCSLTLTELIVSEESVIPKINKIFVDFGIDIYRIEVYEPSLEEIFIKLGNSDLEVKIV